jgi:TRAP-type C4-dicarboxylate transport system permease small subunit
LIPSGLHHQISRVLAWIAGAIILAGCCIPIAIDVISRFLFNKTVVDSFEISGYALAACIGLGMGYTVTTKANVRVDFLVTKLPPPLRRVFDLIASVALAVIAVALTYLTWTKLHQTWDMQAKSISTLQMPLHIPQGIWWVGFFWFGCVAVLTPILAVIRLVQGDTYGFDRMLGTAALSEEMGQIGVNRRSEEDPTAGP